jgi:hypothetical protein
VVAARIAGLPGSRVLAIPQDSPYVTLPICANAGVVRTKFLACDSECSPHLSRAVYADPSGDVIEGGMGRPELVPPKIPEAVHEFAHLLV